jgi:hypothetical protein
VLLAHRLSAARWPLLRGDSNYDGGGSGKLAAKAAHRQDERTAAARVDSESGDGDAAGDGSIATSGTRL